jgi:hypothetical protein
MRSIFEIDLTPYGIPRDVDARDIGTIMCIHTQNWELSQVVVRLKNGMRLYGTIVVGCDAEHLKEKLFREYERILDGR